MDEFRTHIFKENEIRTHNAKVVREESIWLVLS